MSSRYEKVIQRLCYEGYLHNFKIKPAKSQITLKDILTAGIDEPRVLEILPGILLTEPKIIKNSHRDLLQYPDLKRVVEAVRTEKKMAPLDGIPIEDFIKQAKVVRAIFEHKKAGNKSKNLNIRMSQTDIQKLEKLSRTLKLSKSETIRHLLDLNL